jgi:hypothetical protein
MKKENLNNYIAFINNLKKVDTLYLQQANGTNYIKDSNNETVFCGTIRECYFFALGLSRLLM